MSAAIKAMAEVQREIHAVGVGKVRRNQEQKFNFRGIDDAIMAFAPLLDSAALIVIPAYTGLVVSPRQTKSGGTTYNVSVQGTFTFAHGDGSSVVVGPFYGEANDGQDKAISKATSIAYRNALFITFCVPHEPAIGGDPDGIGEDDGGFDITPWADAIKNASDMTELSKIGADLKEKIDAIPPRAQRNIRALWAARSGELK